MQACALKGSNRLDFAVEPEAFRTTLCWFVMQNSGSQSNARFLYKIVGGERSMGMHLQLFWSSGLEP